MDLRERAQQENKKNCIIRNFIICGQHHILDDQIKEEEVSWVCRRYEKDEEGIQDLSWKI
jgi:hypothetical protein